MKLENVLFFKHYLPQMKVLSGYMAHLSQKWSELKPSKDADVLLMTYEKIVDTIEEDISKIIISQNPDMPEPIDHTRDDDCDKLVCEICRTLDGLFTEVSSINETPGLLLYVVDMLSDFKNELDKRVTRTNVQAGDTFDSQLMRAVCDSDNSLISHNCFEFEWRYATRRRSDKPIEEKAEDMIQRGEKVHVAKVIAQGIEFEGRKIAEPIVVPDVTMEMKADNTPKTTSTTKKQ